MATSVSLVELRAWARASRNIARREGFDRTADAVQTWIDLFDEWQNEGHHSIELIPHGASALETRRRMIENGRPI